MKFLILPITTIWFITIPFIANGAVLYLEPSQGEYYPGDTFIQEIRLDTRGEYVNAVEVHITYPADILEAKDFSRGSSVLSLWPEDASYGKGTLSFIGGVPAGYQGHEGVLGKIIFRVKAGESSKQGASGPSGEVRFLEGSKALLNDGEGSEAKLELEHGVFRIVPAVAPKLQDEWEEELARDNISPEPFEVKISKDPSVSGGKYFIIFSAMDKQTGIDHYEVLESWRGGIAENKDARSPYILENQALDGTIRVRAVDEAGNFSIVEIRPRGVEEEGKISWAGIIFGILGLIAVGAGYWLYRYFLKRGT